MVGLTTFDAHGQVIPGIAKSWTVSPDGLVWRFKLRPALWSDGVPVTAQDFVFTYRRLMAPATAAANAGLFYPVLNAEAISQGKLPSDALGASAPDPSTVVIRLARPAPYLPMVLGHYGVEVVPEHAVRRWGEHWTDPGRYVSDGPYRLAYWRLGDRLVLMKNPRFYDADHVCLDKVIYFPTSDMIATERQVKRGELDISNVFDSARMRYLTGRGGMVRYVHAAPWADVIYLFFNMDDPVLRDVRVRQALGMAVDREFIAKRLLAAGQSPTYAFVPPGLGLPAAPEWAGLALAERQALARKLLAEAGYGPDHPLRIELKYPIVFGMIPVAIQADWRAIGVQASLARTDTSVFFGDAQLGDYQVGLVDWAADYMDPTDFLDVVRGDQSGSNYARYHDPVYDDLLRRAEAQVRPDIRARLLQQAEQHMLEAAPIAPLYVNPGHDLVSPRVTGWYDNIYDLHPSRFICFRGLASKAERAR